MLVEMRACQDQKISFSSTCLIGKSDVAAHNSPKTFGLTVSNRLLNQEMSIEKGITCSYTPDIYAEGYITFVFPFVCSFGTFRRVSGIYVKVFG